MEKGVFGCGNRRYPHGLLFLGGIGRSVACPSLERGGPVARPPGASFMRKTLNFGVSPLTASHTCVLRNVLAVMDQ